MKILSATFVKSAPDLKHCPMEGFPEIDVIGRSNVGKSSMINVLTGVKGLAKTSSVPGKTRTMNYYFINEAFYLVDLPGYGYAQVSLAERERWKETLENYFAKREALQGVIVVLDSRRDVTEKEASLYEWIRGYGLPCVTVLTKSDKLSHGEVLKRTHLVKRELGVEKPVLFSAMTGHGKTELGREIDSILKSLRSSADSPP